MSPAPPPRMHGLTHVKGGPDPIPGLAPAPGPAGLAAVILAEPCLVGFWRLNEASGTTAVDSGPNGYHLEPGLDLGPPTWGQPAGPPGEASALFFHTGSGTTDPGLTYSVPGLTGDLTAEIWFTRHDVAGGYMIGQGAQNSTTNGWNLSHETPGGGGWVTLSVPAGGGGGSAPHTDSATTIDTWYHVAVTQSAAGVWNLYLNGAVQAMSFTTPTYTPAAGFWVGDNAAAGAGGAALNASFSYAAIYSCALTPEQILAHYEAGAAGANEQEGWVLTLDEDANSVWLPRGVPDYTAASEGDVLTIVGGVPTWVAP